MSVGRSLGYALNGVRQSTLAYDPATGRLATMLANGCDTPFTWNYLAGSDLKSSLAYPKPMRYRYRLKESDLSLWGSYRSQKFPDHSNGDRYGYWGCGANVIKEKLKCGTKTIVE